MPAAPLGRDRLQGRSQGRGQALAAPACASRPAVAFAGTVWGASCDAQTSGSPPDCRLAVSRRQKGGGSGAVSLWRISDEARQLGGKLPLNEWYSNAGTYSSQSAFGWYDDLVLFNRALMAAEMLEVYSCSAAPAWATAPTGLPTGTAAGQVVIYSGTAWVPLPVGTDGQILTADSTKANGLAWEAASLPAGASKGQIAVYTGSAWALLSVGVDRVVSPAGRHALPRRPVHRVCPRA